jgi:hypothetical protein
MRTAAPAGSTAMEDVLFSSSLTPLLLTVVHLLVPGILLGLAAGAPLVLAVTAAPIVTFGLVTLTSRLTASTGLDWAPTSFWVLVVVASALVWLLRRLLRGRGLRRRLPWPDGAERVVESRSWQVVVVVSALAAGALGAGIAVWGMGGLGGINQEFDVLFHVNAVELITQTHDADPASIGAVNHFDYGTTSYPVAFHALAALPAMLGVNAVVATNALVALIPAVLALGLAGLLWELRLTRQAAVVPFVVISIATFPFDLMWRGPIWPFAMGVALIPAFMTCLVGAFQRRSLPAALLAALGAAGVLAVHPSGALSAAIFAAAYFLQRWGTRSGSLRSDIVPLVVVAVAAVVMALPSVLVALANSGYGVSYDWPAVQTPGASIGELLTFNYFASYPQIWLFVAMVIGWVCVRRIAAASWWLISSAVFAVLLVLAGSYEGSLVATLTGPWWNDRFRFSALAVLGMAVLCAHGLVVVAEGVAALARRVRIRSLDRRPVIALLLVVAVFGVLTAGFYAGYNRERLQKKYAFGTGGSVTPAEVVAMDRLAELVGPGQTVMNDPGDGSAWMWALHGIRPMFGQAIVTPVRPPLEPDVDQAINHFNCLDSSSRIRQIVDEFDIHYVYVGNGFIFPDMHRVKGLEALSRVRSLTLVFENSGARIYKVAPQELIPRQDDVACRIAAAPGDADAQSAQGDQGQSQNSGDPAPDNGPTGDTDATDTDPTATGPTG